VEVIEWRGSLRGREIEAGDDTYLCDNNYPVIGSRNNPACPDGGSTHRWEFRFEIRDLGLTPAPLHSKLTNICGSLSRKVAHLALKQP
jgi:hypothetical protein